MGSKVVDCYSWPWEVYHSQASTQITPRSRQPSYGPAKESNTMMQDHQPQYSLQKHFPPAPLAAPSASPSPTSTSPILLSTNTIFDPAMTSSGIRPCCFFHTSNYTNTSFPTLLSISSSPCSKQVTRERDSALKGFERALGAGYPNSA